jgi:glycosyltransferase involved in cell wall biosynthesis
MTLQREPLVSVLTPVYNGEKFLAQCIGSILAQTYSNFQYTIVNNCSTDGTLEIAESFARQDPRIRIHNNTEFLSVVDNHNKAFSLITEGAKYCKIVGADDWLFPNCISELVKVAEEYPTVGMVTSYVLVGSRVGWDGLPFPSTFMKGRDVCRLRLLQGTKVFGGPSASLLRASVVQERQPFYKLGNYHGDTEAYLDLLQEHDFGFVHQVLSYNRRGEDSRTTHFLQKVNSYVVADIEELTRYGPVYLTKEERAARLRQATKTYYQFLAQSVLEMQGTKFWQYHKERMRSLGQSIDYSKLSRYVLTRIFDGLLNPKRALESLVKKISARTSLYKRTPAAPASPVNGSTEAAGAKHSSLSGVGD